MAPMARNRGGIAETIRSREMGFFRRFFSKKMYASLGCGALSAECTAGPSSPFRCFLFSWA